MASNNNEKITVKSTVKASPEKVWKYFSEPDHIKKWNQASEDWHTTSATNDLQVGGNFTSRMEAKDGSIGFNFEGEYTKVDEHRLIEYKMSDGRSVSIKFSDEEGSTNIEETFDPEGSNPADMQRDGWQAILDNFKKYVEESEGDS